MMTDDDDSDNDDSDNDGNDIDNDFLRLHCRDFFDHVSFNRLNDDIFPLNDPLIPGRITSLWALFAARCFQNAAVWCANLMSS